MRSVLAAVGFLTRVPVGRALSGNDVARGTPYFPLVGAAVGALGAAVAVSLDDVFLSAALAVGAVVLVTGAFHVDALADTADAVGGMTRERALEIMRDSRIGTFGAAAVALDLIIRVAAVEHLVVAGRVWGTLIAAGALSRAASVVLSTVLPYPRAGGGPGSVLTGLVSRRRVGIAVVLALVVSGVALRVDALAAGGAVLATAVLLGLVYRRWLGGATGDALGAVSELSELAALVVVAAIV